MFSFHTNKWRVPVTLTLWYGMYKMLVIWSQDLLHFLILHFFQLATLMQDTCQTKIAMVEIKRKK
jgi:hypothetical protein